MNTPDVIAVLLSHIFQVILVFPVESNDRDQCAWAFLYSLSDERLTTKSREVAKPRVWML